MSKPTPGPWTVAYSTSEHSIGSPNCFQQCAIRPPDSIRYVDGKEFHTHIPYNRVDDILGADGSHVVCLGHDYDYDDSGSISNVANARLISAAPDGYELAQIIARWSDNKLTREELGQLHKSAITLARAIIAKVEGQ